MARTDNERKRIVLDKRLAIERHEHAHILCMHECVRHGRARVQHAGTTTAFCPGAHSRSGGHFLCEVVGFLRASEAASLQSESQCSFAKLPSRIQMVLRHIMMRSPLLGYAGGR